MGIRMKKLLPSHPWSNGRGSILLFLTLALAFLFVACGDDDSSSFVEPEKESSDSGATLSGDSHEGSSPSSCSSKDDKSSSSVSSSSTNSSSSAKSSSSTDAKSSSSSSLVLFESSSSLSKQLRCLLECTDDCEGETYWQGSDYQMICHDGQWLNLDSMEQANAPSSSSYFDMTEQFNPDVEYGEFTDPRDGQKYRTVSLYDDVYERTLVFFVENLNYGERVPGGTVQGKGTKYCYDDDPWYCDNGWGGLYTWSNAMGFPTVCDSVSISAEACAQKFEYPSGYIEPANYVQHQGICPEGWHVVNGGEWAYLDQKAGDSFAYYMGSKVAGFGSKNSYGLSILPAGYWLLYPSGTMAYDNITKQTVFWLPEQDRDQANKAKLVNVLRNDMTRSTSRAKSEYAHSVRCVKNY